MTGDIIRKRLEDPNEPEWTKPGLRKILTHLPRVNPIESVVCFLWKPHEGYRTTFLPEHVNTLERMCRRWYPFPFEFICFTDHENANDFSAGVTPLPLWTKYADVPNPSGPKNPSCYRRLRLFDPDIEFVIRKRFVWLDLDVVVTGDLTPLWNRPEEIVLLENYNPQTVFNGSMALMTAGARPQVWTDFDPIESPKASLAAKQWGSDQGWISYKLGPGEARWTTKDGVYSFRNHMRRDPDRLPKDARLVVCHGLDKPWTTLQKHAWCRDNWL